MDTIIYFNYETLSIDCSETKYIGKGHTGKIANYVEIAFGELSRVITVDYHGLYIDDIEVDHKNIDYEFGAFYDEKRLRKLSFPNRALSVNVINLPIVKKLLCEGETFVKPSFYDDEDSFLDSLRSWTKKERIGIRELTFTKRFFNQVKGDNEDSLRIIQERIDSFKEQV